MSSLKWLISFALLTVAGCAQLSPLPFLKWPKNRLDAPYAVIVAERIAGVDCRFGSGVIIHSCDKHGIIVLTAAHTITDSQECDVTLFSGKDTAPLCVRAHRIFIGRCVGDLTPDDFESTVNADYLEGKSGAVDVVTRLAGAEDLALLKLSGISSESVCTIDLSSVSLESVPLGEDIELAAVLPERFPHRHRFVWNQSFPEDMFAQGHSGGALIWKGRVVGVAASRLDSRWLVFGRISVLKERVGLSYPWLFQSPSSTRCNTDE